MHGNVESKGLSCCIALVTQRNVTWKEMTDRVGMQWHLWRKLGTLNLHRQTCCPTCCTCCTLEILSLNVPNPTSRFT